MTYIDDELDKFKAGELKALIKYSDIDAYKEIFQNILNHSTDTVDASETFRSEEIEFNPGIIETVQNDIGYFVDRFYGGDILDYLLSKYSESAIDEKLEERGSDYTVSQLKEILEENPRTNIDDLSTILYFALIEYDYLDWMSFQDELLQDYSYELCKAIGLTDDQIY